MIYSNKILMNGQDHVKITKIEVILIWTINEMIEEGDCLTPELKILFKQYPEKKEEYKKIYESQISGGGSIQATHKWCDTCMFCEVIEPLGRQPQTRYCKIYEPKDSHGKPDEVIYEGARCEYYEKEKPKKEGAAK